MIVATISTAAAADTLPGLVTGSLNPVMAVGHNATAGNMTGTESLPSARELSTTSRNSRPLAEKVIP